MVFINISYQVQLFGKEIFGDIHCYRVIVYGTCSGGQCSRQFNKLGAIKSTRQIDRSNHSKHFAVLAIEQEEASKMDIKNV
jgi:hypothetical protein